MSIVATDQFNVAAARSRPEADELNRTFYSRFSYPYPPIHFDRYVDPDFNVRLLAQDIGDFERRRLRRSNLRIWVAGCGTNQALITALSFPDSTVLGTDLSPRSLELCEANAKQLGVDNLKLVELSINEAPFDREFDYVICTGVIHHNAEPEWALRRLAAALTGDGVLELMVYNYFHRIATTAFQKALRGLLGSTDNTSLDEQIALTRSLIDSYPAENLMGEFLKYYRGAPEPMIADALLQPIEYSYTVETFNAMATRCGLEILQPKISGIDRTERRLTWNVDFREPALRSRYEGLPDLERWQLGNLMLAERSPFTWFYLGRPDASVSRRSEAEVTREFLSRPARKAQTKVHRFEKRPDGGYATQPSAIELPVPARPGSPALRRLYDNLADGEPLGRVFKRLNLPSAFLAANAARVGLAAPTSPYLLID